MARNFILQHLRGILANLPTLSLGELYLAADTTDLYGGVTAGNARLTVPCYSKAGVQKPGYHIVADQVALVGGTATVALSGAAAFTNATSYFVVASEGTANHPMLVTRVSGTSFTITGTGTDVISFIAAGV
jgi:hypothetical protein